jgi:hypothetical protein
MKTPDLLINPAAKAVSAGRGIFWVGAADAAGRVTARM